jgi:hypothetical protein
LSCVTFIIIHIIFAYPYFLRDDFEDPELSFLLEEDDLPELLLLPWLDDLAEGAEDLELLTLSLLCTGSGLEADEALLWE